MQKVETSTKNVTFRSNGEEEFQVQITFKPKGNKIVATSSSVNFLNYLRELNLVDSYTSDNTWFYSCDSYPIDFISNSRLSFKIRKKASLLGLNVIPGKRFQNKKENDCKIAFKKTQQVIKHSTSF